MSKDKWSLDGFKIGVAIACLGVAALFFIKPHPELECEFYDSSQGVVVHVTPMPGYKFPAGDFNVTVTSTHVSGHSYRAIGRDIAKRLFDGSKEFKFKEADLALGGVWFVCPFEREIEVEIPGLNRLEVYCPENGKCGKRLP